MELDYITGMPEVTDHNHNSEVDAEHSAISSYSFIIADGQQHADALHDG
jgi:hypothetical protein